MKHRNHQSAWRRISPIALTGLALGTASTHAQERPNIDFSQFEGRGDEGWHVRVGGRALFNAKASVSRTPSLPLSSPGNFYYDNGSVLTDIGGPASGLTWNWGYQDASQVVGAGSAINYERYTGLPDAGSFAEESAIAPGGEVMFGIRFGEFEVGDKTWQWGAEFGGGYNLFQISNAETATSNATYTTATHNANGILIPDAPYQGTFNGPGPVIDLAPSNQVDTPAAATSTVDGDLKSDLYNLKIGVWLDIPVTKSLDVSLSTGFSSLYADTTYAFTENVVFAGGGVPALTPIDTEIGGRNWQQGGYLQARLQYEFNDQWSVWAGAEFQYNGKFGYSGAGRDVALDFRTLFSGSLGVQFNW